MTTFQPVNPLSALHHDTMIVIAQCLKSQESRISQSIVIPTVQFSELSVLSFP